jgi:hypothetical protein
MGCLRLSSKQGVAGSSPAGPISKVNQVGGSERPAYPPCPHECPHSSVSPPDFVPFGGSGNFGSAVGRHRSGWSNDFAVVGKPPGVVGRETLSRGSPGPVVVPLLGHSQLLKRI